MMATAMVPSPTAEATRRMAPRIWPGYTPPPAARILRHLASQPHIQARPKIYAARPFGFVLT
jgi:hypothetical protein